MKKHKQTTIDELIKERNQLYVNRSNPNKLKELIQKIDFFFFGIC